MMNDDLIYRSVLKEHIGSYAGMFTDELGFVVSLEAVLRGIDFVEAIDAVEVVHGKWIVEYGRLPRCSHCGKPFYGAINSPMNFCANCGADMRKEGNDE